MLRSIGREEIALLGRLRKFLELIRFSHTIFALPFALLSAVLAWRTDEGRLEVDGRQLVGILLCMVFARSAAMAFNRLVDRRIDAENPRTQGRHLPAGLLSIVEVRVFALVCATGFIAATLIFLPNWWPVALSVPVLAFLLGYSYAKRFTAWSHYWLAAGLMLSPPAAWIAIRGELDWTPAALGGAVFFWVGGFDIIYACQDLEFDRRRGLKSLPVRLGIPAALVLAAGSHLAAVVCLFALWYLANLGHLFLIGVVCMAGLLIYEHSLVRPDDLTRVNVAFFNVNAVISLGLFAVGLADVLFG